MSPDIGMSTLSRAGPDADHAAELASLRERLARSEENTARTLMRATRLAQIISVLGSQPDLQSTTERVATEIGELFFTDMALLFLDTDQRLSIAGHWGLAAADLPGYPVTLAEISALSAERSIIIGPASEMELPDWIAPYRPRHVAWARLLVGDRPIGALMLARCGDEPFVDSEATELRAISYRVALAVENGLLHQRMREQLARLSRLQQITATFAGILDLDAIGLQVAETLVGETSITRAAVLIDRGGECRLLATAGENANRDAPHALVPPLGDHWKQFPLTVADKTVGVVGVIGAPEAGSGEDEVVQHLVDLGALSLEKALLYEQTLQLARHDSLTGLLGHRVCHETLAELVHTGDPFSVLVLDIDDFKQVNDLHGHQTGDRTLCLVADALKHCTRATDAVFRIGGEEFCAVLPGPQERDAFSVAESLRRRVVMVGHELPMPVTLSIGVASFPTHAATREDVLARADAAMYASKRAGKNRVSTCGETTPEGTSISSGDISLRLLHDKDADTASHSAHVATLAVEIGRSMGLDVARLNDLRTGARLHDIGKVGVPDSILRKPGPLNHEEFRVMKTHPVTGAELLSLWGLPGPAVIVRQHHERIDGAGYPAGLRGEEIMVEARIIHAADAYVAMTRDRPYRRALSVSQAQTELRRHRGTQFDPDVVDALLALCSQPEDARGPLRALEETKPPGPGAYLAA